MTRPVAVLIAIAIAATLRGGVVDVSPERGRAVALIHWISDNGRARELSEFSGYPLILLPIYTRCPGACVQNVDRLKEALADSSIDPSRFRVLLFSFDPADTPETLAKYRHRENIPLGWSLGTASKINIDALLESIGFPVGQAGTEFTHPNLLIFLDPNLRIAKWIYGTDYLNADVDLALQVAAGRSDWLGRHSDVLYALLLFAASVLCVALVYYVCQVNQPRRICNREEETSSVAGG